MIRKYQIVKVMADEEIPFANFLNHTVWSKSRVTQYVIDGVYVEHLVLGSVRVEGC